MLTPTVVVRTMDKAIEVPVAVTSRTALAATRSAGEGVRKIAAFLREIIPSSRGQIGTVVVLVANLPPGYPAATVLQSSLAALVRSLSREYGPDWCRIALIIDGSGSPGTEELVQLLLASEGQPLMGQVMVIPESRGNLNGHDEPVPRERLCGPR